MFRSIFFDFGFAGILEVLHCILVESPEALNIIQKGHIKSIISLLYKHGRNHKVGWEILCVTNSLCCLSHLNPQSAEKDFPIE